MTKTFDMNIILINSDLLYFVMKWFNFLIIRQQLNIQYSFSFHLKSADIGIIVRFLFSTWWLWVFPVVFITRGLVKFVMPLAPQPNLFFFIQCLKIWPNETDQYEFTINLLCKRNLPIYRFSKSFFFNVMMAVVEYSFRSSWSFEVFNVDVA